MKRILKTTAFAFLVMLVSSLSNTIVAQYNDRYNDQYNDQYKDQNYDQGRDVSYQTFYDELSPYGRWVEYPGQGYVWVPDAGEDFRPYSTNGHWVWSDNYEWVWVSDYDWGWAPFHYGRWDQDPNYGWYWVPGYEWSPAWVAWRDGGDYYGWAPIRPGISFNINFNIGSYSPPIDFWCFAPRRYINSPRIYDYYTDRRQNVTIINFTTIISNNYQYGNNYGFRSGPRRYDAERYCGRINPVRFRQTNQPGRSTFRNNEVSIYRPSVRQDNNRSFTPRSFERYDRNNNNNGFRRGNIENRNDNIATNQDRRNNSGFERRNGNVRQPQNNNDNNNNPEGRRFERRDINDQPNRNGNSRDITAPERRNRNAGIENNNNNDRRFERRDINNPPDRQPQQMERRQESRQPQQMERRQEPRQPQQMERRQEPRQPVERRTESRQLPAEPRQFERKDDGNREQKNGSNNETRISRKRF